MISETLRRLLETSLACGEITLEIFTSAAGAVTDRMAQNILDGYFDGHPSPTDDQIDRRRSWLERLLGD